ncbi:hypothetical protein [Candidatus Contubernalis alkaliaceticus]|uniref:hypothetical protein n=1 Tax=Candidatus Contubernalis alkaliaceticus TaxID=338645 RepID=UPI001F4C0DA3|nr:hypothetical protein [Candidatus Contubernalis alkalaceticus]UNC91548.1 hypothetical protein HUE98_05260 [Candidatus Contubernalis alkalaceticus]
MKKGLISSLIKWFVGIAWPMILKFFTRVLGEVLEWAMRKVEEFLNNRDYEEAKKANLRADMEEIKAGEAKTTKEADKHKAYAEVWREVAENSQNKNKKLKEQLNVLEMQIKTRVTETVMQTVAEDVFDFKPDEENPESSSISLIHKEKYLMLSDD